MQIYRVFRLIIPGMLATLCAACASEPPSALPTPTAIPRAIVLPITAVLAEPQRWSGQEITIVGSVAIKGEDRVLIASPELGSDPATVPPAEAIWLEEPPPDSLHQEIADDGSILKVRGAISPPGAYGREQRFPYQISATKIEVLQPERTTLANLAQNPHALNGILLSVEGVLLNEQSSALLTNQVSKGGVPTGIYQIKLSGSRLSPALLDQMNRSGEVTWGAVEVVGWWQDGMLTPFKIVLAQEDRSPSPSPAG